MVEEMILLEDDEIARVIEEIEYAFSVKVTPTDRGIAKAQLKKVYENRLAEFIDDRGRECISIDKEALLKECE